MHICCDHSRMQSHRNPSLLGRSQHSDADQTTVLKEVLYSCLCEDKYPLTGEKSKALPFSSSRLLSGKSCDEIFELEPQQAERTMEA